MSGFEILVTASGISVVVLMILCIMLSPFAKLSKYKEWRNDLVGQGAYLCTAEQLTTLADIANPNITLKSYGLIELYDPIKHRSYKLIPATYRDYKAFKQYIAQKNELYKAKTLCDAITNAIDGNNSQ